jgi:hypothetical protein
VGYNEFKRRRILLYTARKFAVLCFFLCVQLLFSEEVSPGEEYPLSEEDFFFEEFFLLERPFSSEDPFFSEESSSDEETYLSEESHPDEETYLSGEFLSGEEAILSEESPPGEEAILSEDNAPLVETFFDENYPSEGGFVFEAPPLILEVPPFVYETRSFDDIFPHLSRTLKMMAFNDEGLKHFYEDDGSPALVPAPDSGIDLLSSVMSKKPSHIIEAMVVVPYNRRELDILDIYNALGKIGNIKDHPLYANDMEVYVFDETTRLESARSRKSIPDPPPANILPYSETMYLRFKDSYYGNLYIRGDVSMSLYGIIYSMTNFTDVRYFLIPIIKAERLSIIIYLEPVKEGVLVYSVSGLYLPGFIADRVNLTPSINRRSTGLLKWIVDSLRKQESLAAMMEDEASEARQTN